jgi:hypothetical protein
MMSIQIQIEVKDAKVERKRITRKDGSQLEIGEQRAYVHVGKPYPTEIVIPVDIAAGQMPYDAGRYQMDPSCLYVDRYGKLSLGRLKLQKPT